MAQPEDLVAAYVDLVEAEWVRGGLPARERRRLCADLERDLLTALAAGAPVAEVFGVDAVTLARDVAQAEGLGLTRAPTRRVSGAGLVVRGLLGAVVMAALVWFVVLPRLADALDPAGGWVAQAVAIVASYVVCGALVLGGAAAMMARYLRHLAEGRLVATYATVAMGVLGAVGVLVSAAVGVRADNDSAPTLLLFYLVTTGALAATGIVIAWRWRSRSTLAFEHMFE